MSNRAQPPPLPAKSAASLAALLFLSGAAATAAGNSISAELLDPQTVLQVTKEQFRQILDHNMGNVVLVNFWATWCIPCIQELPEIDELQHRYRDRGLKVIAVSFDDPALLEERVRPFFAEKAPRLISYLQMEENPHDFAALFDPEWLGSLPTSFVIDRKGEIRKSVTGRLTFRSFEDAILPLLDEAP